MKKIILILLITILTSCSLYQPHKMELDEIVQKFISKDPRKNFTYPGFSVYIPNGVKVIKQSASAFQLSYDNIIFSFDIDLIMILQNKELMTTLNSNDYYSSKIKKDYGNAYIKIEKIDNDFYFLMLYNYGRVEGIVHSTDDLKHIIAKSSVILSSIKYNTKVINRMLNEKNEVSKTFELAESINKKIDNSILNKIKENDNYFGSKKYKNQ